MTGPGTPRALERQILWLLLSVVLSLHFLPRLLTQSMFFDGLIYASIARNLAGGDGSLWHLRFSETLFPDFAEHPPLGIWLQAAAFRVFGDTLAVEKSLALLQLALGGGLLFAIVKRLLRGRGDAHCIAILSLVLALVAGRLSWTFANNMLESTLTLFALVAVYLGIAACEAESRGRRAGLAGMAGLCVAAALLAKGPVGLFPLAAIGLYWLVYRRPSLPEALLLTAAMVAGLALVLFGLWQIDAGRAYLSRYAEQQVFSSLSGARGETGGRLHAMKTLLRMLAYPLLLAALAVPLRRLARGRGRQVRPEDRAGKAGWFLLLVGLSASLPILASPRVWSFYFTPSLPFYGAAIAVWIAPAALGGLAALDARPLRLLRGGLLVVAVIAAGFGLSRFGAPGEDAGLIEAAAAVAEAACPVGRPCAAVVSTCPVVWQDWQLHGYLQRHHRIALKEGTRAAKPDSIFIRRETCGDGAPTGYAQVFEGVEGTDVYRR